MFYTVGCEPWTPSTNFTNKFQAAHLAGTKNLDMHFNMYEDVFDRCNWSKEPDLTWDQLLDIRARQIADKGKPIVLNFSGGTDSYTIYKVFERNNIHIDIINHRARRDERESAQWTQVYDLFSKGLYDPTTRIISKVDDDTLLDEMYPTSDWIWTSCQPHVFSLNSMESREYLADELGTDDFISIIGIEKPVLHIDETGIYSYQLDKTYTRCMDQPHVDCFYISPDLPELHIKQSYMLKNYIKSKLPNATTPKELESYGDFHNPLVFDWLDYSINGCGRFGDINLSKQQHQWAAASKLVVPASGRFEGHEYSGRSSDWFTSAVGTKAFKNYTDGIMSVATDAASVFLHQTDNFHQVRQFRSKPYKLTF